MLSCSLESREISMLLNAVIISCVIVVNAESPLNSYSFTGDSNAYDYSNSVTNSYLGSKDGYQNVGNFYGTGDTSKLSNYVSSHSLINGGNQGNIEGDIDVGSNYNGYSANDHGSEYAGYSNTYENSDRNTYSLSTRATPTSFKGYSDHNNKLNLAFNAYSSGIAQQDSDFGQYKSNNNKRIPAYSGYSNPAVLEHYTEDSDSDTRGYHDSSDSANYSENDQIYPPYSSGEPTSEYSFGKQKGSPYNFNKGHNKYSDVYPIASETRYTRGNAARVNHNRDVPSYLPDSRANGQFLKAHGMSSTYAASGKPSKYSYKYISRYAPNSGLTYLSRERDAYYAPYSKGSGKIIIIKEKRPSHAYSEPSYADNNGYRSKNGGFMSGYSTLSNFDGYGGSSSNYNDGANVPRRYRYAGGPMILQKTVYS